MGQAQQKRGTAEKLRQQKQARPPSGTVCGCGLKAE
jgi:hypothetical protein